MDRLRICRRPWEAAVAHLRAALPDEGVGFFLGTSPLLADRFVPARNLGGARRFLVDPYDQYRAFRQAGTEGRQVVAVCHSHPGGGTSLSEHDAANAGRWPFLQVVVALRSPDDEPRAAAWRCGPEGVVSVALEMGEDGADVTEPGRGPRQAS